MKTFEIKYNSANAMKLIDHQDPIQKESCFPKHRVKMDPRYFDLMWYKSIGS
jgi:hypothetical protein